MDFAAQGLFANLLLMMLWICSELHCNSPLKDLKDVELKSWANFLMLTCPPLQGEKIHYTATVWVTVAEKSIARRQPTPDSLLPGFRTERKTREGVSHDVLLVILLERRGWGFWKPSKDRGGKQGQSYRQGEIIFQCDRYTFFLCKLEIMIPTQDVGILYFRIPNQKWDPVSCF